MKEKICELLLEGKTYNAIVREVGCAKSTVAYHAKRLEIVRGSPFIRDWNKVQLYYNEHGLPKTLNHFDMSRHAFSGGVNRGSITPKYVRRDNIDSNGSGHKYSLDDLLVENSICTDNYRLKKRLVNEDLILYSCQGEGCLLAGIINPVWAGKQITLHLDHINGVNNDYRIENLRFLCPNCHSLTPTYCGKNKKRA